MGSIINTIKRKAFRIAAALVGAVVVMVFLSACPIESEYLDRIREQINAELESPDVPTYTVTYDGNGHTGGFVPVDDNAYVEGTKAVVLGNVNGLEKEGHSFTGWNTTADGSGAGYVAGDELEIGTADVTLCAQWTKTPTYTVTYLGNGNDGGTAPSDGNAYEEGETVTVADKGTLTLTDYYFSGWNSLENGDGDAYAAGNTFSMPASDVELYAQWSENPTYTVTYSGTGSDGGTVPSDSNYYEEGDGVTVKYPGDMTKTDHFFIEWNREENGNGDAYNGGDLFQMGSENVTLFAIWAPEETKILATDGTSMDHFGISVSIDGDYAIAGAEYAGTIGNVPGAAYIFHRTAPNIWDTGTKIVGDDTVSDDTFGRSVCISGDYAIVGAPYDDDGGSAAGTAFIFHRTGTNSWDERIKITASIADANDQFGHSVAIDGDYAIVGVYRDDDKGSDAGAAYIFHRTGPGNTWDSGTKITASDGEGSDYFGWSVDISGDYVIVGAYQENSHQGAAYVFHRTGSPNTWDSGTKITASDGEGSDYFGDSVAIDGSCAIIGAPGDDDKGDYAGAAYTYDLVGENWVYRTKITPLNGDPDDRFGEDVSIDGDYALVGVHRDDDIATNAGSAFLFHRTGTYTWSEDKFYASDYAAEDYYGYSADISGNYALVGAYKDDDKDTDSGSAYIYYIEQE